MYSLLGFLSLEIGALPSSVETPASESHFGLMDAPAGSFVITALDAFSRASATTTRSPGLLLTIYIEVVKLGQAHEQLNLT